MNFLQISVLTHDRKMFYSSQWGNVSILTMQVLGRTFILLTENRRININAYCSVENKETGITKVTQASVLLR